MAISKTLHVGWIPNLDVPAAIRRLSSHQIGGLLILVSMIDSTPRVSRLPSLVPLLQQLDASYCEIDDDVLIDGPTLMMLIEEHQFLMGFDEIWLFAEAPTSGKPNELRITSDVRLSSPPPDGLQAWMRDVHCLAGLGDGHGLNFATYDESLAAQWQR
jgi:hypothetical protein